MKASFVSLYLLTATLFAGSACAEDAALPATPAPAGTPAAPKDDPRKARLLERFDANHDGKLDETERATARAEGQKRGGSGPAREYAEYREFQEFRQFQRWKRMAKWHDHAEPGEARAAGQQMHEGFQTGRKQALERFDANHDGRLDPAEHQNLQQAWQKFIEQQPVVAPAAAAGK